MSKKVIRGGKAINRKAHMSIQTLIGLCKRIEDPRRRWGNKRHELTDVLVTAWLAIICGCGSWETDAAALHRYIRGHWSIENQLHWMLDVAFHED